MTEPLLYVFLLPYIACCRIKIILYYHMEQSQIQGKGPPGVFGEK
jgi:hypothetical protein